MTWTLAGVIEDAAGDPQANLTIEVNLDTYPGKDSAGKVVRVGAKVATDGTGALTADGGGPCVLPTVPGAVWRVSIAPGRTVKIPQPADGATVQLRDYVPSGNPAVTESEAALLRARLDQIEANGTGGGSSFTWTDNGDGTATLTTSATSTITDNGHI